jgi:O-antigen ligase
MVLLLTVAFLGLSLLMSQTAIDVFASLLFLEMLWFGYRWHQQKSTTHSLFNRTGIDWMFVVWFLVVLAGYAVQGFQSGNWNDNWYYKLLEFRWIIVFYCLLAAIRYLRPNSSWVRPIAIGFGACSLWAIIVWFLGWDPLHPEMTLQTFPNGALRTGGFLSQPIVFAHLYQLPLAILVGLFLTMLRWREKGTWIVGLSVLLGGIALLLSFTRGVWISFAAAVVVMTFLFNRRIAFGLVIFMGIAGFAAFKTIPVFSERVRESVNGSEFERVWIWKANLEMFKDHPILGIGYGDNNVEALQAYYKKLGSPEVLLDAQANHAHNQYLQMLSGTGIIGFVVYMAIMVYFFVLALRVWRSLGSREVFQQGLALGLIGAQVAFLVGGLTEANLEHSKLRHTLMFVWALTVWLAYEYNVLREKV